MFKSVVCMYVAFGSDTSIEASVPELLFKLSIPWPVFNSIAYVWLLPNNEFVSLITTPEPSNHD